MKRLFIISIVALSILFATVGEHIFAGQSADTAKETSALSGRVVETMDVDRYTYVCLEKNGKKLWLAAPKMKVVVGQNMSFRPGIEMLNFESKTLNRKFDKIIFSQGPVAGNEMKSK
jgi:hypothetical protein